MDDGLPLALAVIAAGLVLLLLAGVRAGIA
jgi:hypothetical protein